jgi:tetratricopeptide (TPR) repeat protein
VNAQDFATRAEAACRQNQRFEAIVNWRLARQAAPSDANYWYCEALTLVSAGELPAYRHVCDEALQQFRNSDIATCSRTAQIAALGPDAVSSDRWAQVRALAQRAVDAEPGNADHAARLGAVCYRAGDYQAAIEHLKRALPQPDTNGAAVQSENQARRLEVVATVWTRPFLAMAHYRQNDPVEAQRWLDLAEQSKKENSDIRSSADWGDWLIWSVLLQEAHVLVPATPNATAETNAS